VSSVYNTNDLFSKTNEVFLKDNYISSAVQKTEDRGHLFCMPNICTTDAKKAGAISATGGGQMDRVDGRDFWRNLDC